MRNKRLLSLIAINVILTACSPPAPLDKTTPKSPTTVSYSGWGIQSSNSGETANKLSSVSVSLTNKTKSVNRIKHSLTRGLMVGSLGTLVLITNNGKTLKELVPPTNLNIRDGEITETKIWVVGKDPVGGESVWVSANNGLTWTKELNTSDFYFQGDHVDSDSDRLSAINLISETEVLVGGSLRDGLQVLLKRDQLGNWFDSLIEASQLVTRITSISKTDDSFVVTGNSGMVAVSFDSGDTWTSSYVETGSDLNKVSCREVVCFVTGASGFIGLSTDSGFTWETATSPTQFDIYAVSLQLTIDAYRVYIGDSNGEIFYSDNLGLTWLSAGKKTSLPILDILMMTPSSGWASSGLLTGSSGSLLFQESL
jgi:photosystem II stability/assembly factor-like uncharacterized protein